MEAVRRDADVEVRQLTSDITKLEQRVDIIMGDRDHVSNQLDAERLLSAKYKDEFERVQREYLEHQKICERYLYMMMMILSFEASSKFKP